MTRLLFRNTLIPLLLALLAFAGCSAIGDDEVVSGACVDINIQQAGDFTLDLSNCMEGNFEDFCKTSTALNNATWYPGVTCASKGYTLDCGNKNWAKPGTQGAANCN